MGSVFDFWFKACKAHKSSVFMASFSSFRMKVGGPKKSSKVITSD